MKKITHIVFYGFAVFIPLAVFTGVNAQSKPGIKTATLYSPRVQSPGRYNTVGLEKVSTLFLDALENVRVQNGVSQDEFYTFYRFENNAIHLLKSDVLAQARKDNFDPSSLSAIQKQAENNIGLLYKKFQIAEKLYPSSVDEYRHIHSITQSNPCDSTGCNNIGFENGNLSGWYGYYAVNSSSTTQVIIDDVTGGALGAVTEACNDPDVIQTMATLNGAGFRDTDLTTDYQLSVTSGGYDHIIPSIPRVSPWGGSHSVLLGDSQIVGYGVAILSKTFLVTASNSSLTYQYALFLNNPVHVPTQQPFFKVGVLDENGDTIPYCGAYNVVSGYGISGFDSINYYGYDGVDKVYYRDWTIVNVPLKNYVGQCVTIVFEVADCGLGGHFGYAYVDASCAPIGIISSSPNLCGQDSLSLTAPPGASSYQWVGPANGIISNTTQQTVWIDSAGVYRVVAVPVTGESCADTLYDTVGRFPGPPPVPGFSVTPACAGEPVHFINLSTDTATATFYWDFYNIGIYNDTNVINPSWTYASPGIYTVKLEEIYNGCGADTLINVVVDTVVNGSYTYSVTGCPPEASVSFTNTSVGATSYYWNYGDPSSGTTDTSTAVSSAHTYTVAGTYTVTMVARNGGPCPDTVREALTILGVPVPTIRGGDSVCSGGLDTLSASGGTTYLWEPGGQTSSSITISISSPTTYTLTATTGCGSTDTTFAVGISAAPIAMLTANTDSICAGDTVFMTAGGGTRYLWSTGATSTALSVTPGATSTYTLFVYSAATTCFDSAEVTVYVTPKVTSNISLSKDSICSGASTVLSVTSNGVTPIYYWSNGSTSSSITVTPLATTTYYVLTEGYCAFDSASRTVNVQPTPTLTVTAPDTVCKGTDALLTATGATNYAWSNGSTTSSVSITINGNSSVTVIGSNGNCLDSAKRTILIYPPLLSVSTQANDSLCRGGSTTISVSVTGGHPSYTYSWNNGITSDSAGPVKVTVPPGQYVCTITDGCNVVLNDTVNIVIDPSPTAKFQASPDSVPGGGFVNFVNLSSGASSYYWNLGDGTTTTDTAPYHEYNQAGVYIVILVATNSYGCTDTATGYIYATEIIKVPNVFTPNGDGINDAFHVTAGGLKTYDIKIFNRWGVLVFEADSPNIDWTGRSTSGLLESDGIYYYVIQATDYAGRNYSKDGYVQLIR